MKGGKLISYLKKHPDVVKGLTKHRRVPSIIYRLGVRIEPISYVHVHSSRGARQNYGLMANDSLIIAFMEKNHIRHLVTNDDDFKRDTEKAAQQVSPSPPQPPSPNMYEGGDKGLFFPLVHVGRGG